MKELILVAAMMGVLLVTAFANDENEIEDKRADFRKEQRAYFKENIKPKVDAQRNILEESISATDKKEIARLREEIIKQKLIENEFLFQARAAHIKGEEFNEGLETELQAQQIVIENLLDKAKIIANTYRPQIDDLLASVKDDLAENRPEMNGPKGDFSRGKNDQHRRGSNERGSFEPMNRGFGHNMHGDLGIVAFLLWDVNRG